MVDDEPAAGSAEEHSDGLQDPALPEGSRDTAQAGFPDGSRDSAQAVLPEGPRDSPRVALPEEPKAPAPKRADVLRDFRKTLADKHRPGGGKSHKPAGGNPRFR